MMPVRKSQNWLPGIFNDFFGNEWMEKANSTSPAINIIESEKDYKVEIAAPGLTKDDFSIRIDDDNQISVSMEKKEEHKDENKNGHTNTIGNKNTVSYGLYRMHGFISATDAAKTRFSEEDKEILFNAIINAFENDHAAARGEMNPRALIVFKHESPLGNARAGQLFDLIQVNKKEGVEFPRSFGDYKVTSKEEIEAVLKNRFPNVTVKELI